MSQQSSRIVFDDNSFLKLLLGENDQHLHRVEDLLHVDISCRGNVVAVSGEQGNIDCCQQVLRQLYQKLTDGSHINIEDVDAAVRMNLAESGDNDNIQRASRDIIVKTPKKHITPRSKTQEKYIQELLKKDMVFATGPAGTGKTYLAIAVAIALFNSNEVERIILARPAVEAGEKIGFLPGNMKEKIDPYMQPLYDALYDMFPGEKIQKYLDNRTIEVSPLAFMRGRTLNNAYIIMDEAQNATAAQMKMFLTRLGKGSKMVINGDLSQTDLPKSCDSGLRDALKRLNSIEEISYISFGKKDIVRHDLVSKIVQCYDG